MHGVGIRRSCKMPSERSGIALASADLTIVEPPSRGLAVLKKWIISGLSVTVDDYADDGHSVHVLSAPGRVQLRAGSCRVNGTEVESGRWLQAGPAVADDRERWVRPGLIVVSPNASAKFVEPVTARLVRRTRGVLRLLLPAGNLTQASGGLGGIHQRAEGAGGTAERWSVSRQ
jgi:hypothetical protein